VTAPLRLDLHAHDIAPAVARVLRHATRNRLAQPVQVDREAWEEFDVLLRLVLQGHRSEPSWWVPEQAAEMLGCTPQHVWWPLLCRACGTVMHRTLRDAGVEYHLPCGPE
jgi:hypothetical protein